MDYNKIHLIESDKINVLFHYQSFTMMTVDRFVFQIISELKNGKSVLDVSTKYRCTENDVILIIKSIEEKISNQINSDRVKCEVKKRHLDRITLHVSNDCNLKCKYCYASGGNYQLECGLMSRQTAKRFVDFCCQNFDKIDRIVFFGGEPMLNVEIMEIVCNLFKSNFTNGKISCIPDFGMVTNGTIINDEIISFIKENISNITVSIDGPKEINDINRVYSNGKGSYEKIKKFINRIKSETNIPLSYEATYTKQHIEYEYQPKDICNFMLSEFGIKGIVVEEDSLETSHLLTHLRDVNFDEIVENNFENMPAGFWSILQSITIKRSQEVCPVMKNIFSVSSNGGIFPCHMLTGNVTNNMGNVAGKNFFNKGVLSNEESFILNLQDNPNCNSCWCKSLCGGCAVQRFYNQQTKQFSKKPNSELCEITKEYFEEIILMLAILRQNPTYWQKLLAKVKER